MIRSPTPLLNTKLKELPKNTTKRDLTTTSVPRSAYEWFQTRFALVFAHQLSSLSVAQAVYYDSTGIGGTLVWVFAAFMFPPDRRTFSTDGPDHQDPVPPWVDPHEFGTSLRRYTRTGKGLIRALSPVSGLQSLRFSSAVSPPV